MNSKKLDIAQRIAEALSRTGEPTHVPPPDNDEGDAVIIGVVPIHLRHFYDLLVECRDEIAETKARLATQANELKKIVLKLRSSILRASTDLTDISGADFIKLLHAPEATQRLLHEQMSEWNALKVIFFRALEMYATEPEGTTSVRIGPDWVVYATASTEDSDREDPDEDSDVVGVLQRMFLKQTPPGSNHRH